LVLNQWCFFWSITLHLKTKRQKDTVLKGPYTAIIVSVLLHLVLLLALIYGAQNSPKVIKQAKPKPTAIKSFLYSAPKKKPLKKPPPTKVILDKVVAKKAPDKKIPAKKVAAKKVTSKPSTAKVLPKKITRDLPSVPPTKKLSQQKPSQVTNAVKSETVTTKNKVSGTSRGSFSSYDRLSRLREKLANQQRDDAFAELTQQRSASVMDGEQFPVPKTTVPLTQEQTYEKNTSKSHVGSITKNDNGTCTIHREQILGSPVEATTSSFACGESKFDKGFREHMQKVQAKLGIQKK
jgi:hypothetical protein